MVIASRIPCRTGRGHAAIPGRCWRAALLAVLLHTTAVVAETSEGEPGPTDGPPPPRGGSYVHPGGVADVTRVDEVLRVTWFDPGFDTVTIEGQPLSGRRFPPGISAWDYEGSAVIAFGEDRAVVLRGITVAEWRSGASRQLHGTPLDDVLEGTDDTDVIAGGGDADDITPSGGDDRINYGSGNDVIHGGEGNRGYDTLDLRRFRPDQVHFAADQVDALIATPAGTIRLEGQLAAPPDTPLTNIELILLNEEEVNEAEIRSRALAGPPLDRTPDSASPAHRPTFVGGEGDDRMGATDGQDLYVFQPGDGDDTIIGFDPVAGDTLRFVGIRPDEVATKPSGTGALVTYPGGSVRLAGVRPGSLSESNLEVRPELHDPSSLPIRE